jgi:hypothetical protein
MLRRPLAVSISLPRPNVIRWTAYAPHPCAATQACGRTYSPAHPDDALRRTLALATEAFAPIITNLLGGALVPDADRGSSRTTSCLLLDGESDTLLAGPG